jgi:xanthine dehydrogenase accessory factor
VGDDLLGLAFELRQRQEPFALATVVRCERPTSAKPGAKALIRQDGTVSGWIGGACAEPVVVREALGALRDGQPRFIALVGEGRPGRGPTEGVREYAMTCHSGGTLEIYVEPFLPRPLLVLVGQGPVVQTLAALGRATDFAVVVLGVETGLEGLARLELTPRASVVVATHGSFDEDALEDLLRREVGYVSLVASRKRAAAVIDTLRRRGVPPERIGRLKAPAGLDIAAVTPEEIAVSILAEIVQSHRTEKAPWRDAAAHRTSPAGTEATDPICGMLVEIAGARYRSQLSGDTVYFCCLRCKETFDADPRRYSAALRA